MKKILLVLVVLTIAFTMSGCMTSSDRVSDNLSKEIEEFRVPRRIVAMNGFNNEPVFEAQGYCSIETAESKVAGAMEIICKVGPNEFTKDFIYISDNVNIVIEQMYGIDVPQYHKKLIFAPQSIIPVFEITGDDLGE